jgi:hypothetical protein
MILEVVYGASGPSTANGRDFNGVQNTGTGQIKVSFSRAYRKLVHFSHAWKKKAAGAVLFPVCNDGTTIATSNADGSASVVLETRTETGTATNPANGDILVLSFDLSNDVLTDGYPVTVS